MSKEYDASIKGNILIVDDSLDNLRLLSSVLMRQNYRVHCVADGEMALHAIRGELPNLILLDVVLPAIDGYKLCKILKSKEKTRHIPIIFISSLDSESDKVQAFKLGCADFITKPFFIEELLVRVETQFKILREKENLQKLLYQNIKDRKTVEQELNQSRALLAGVLNSSLDGVAAFEAVRDRWGHIIDFRWVVVNPVAAMTVGETGDSLKGQLLLETIANNLFDGLFDSFIQVVESCIVLDKEHFYSHEGNWFHIVAVKLGDGFAVNFRDITERKQIEIALKEANLELQRQANIDSLTQVANRRRFDEYLSQEWSRCAREKQSLSLIICDVDYFKFYNDAYGHQAGDQCLYQVAQGMAKAIKRPADVVFRYGGEEFAMILPITQGNGALKVAQDVRERIVNLQIPHDLSQVNQYVTLSLGVSSIVPHAESSPEALIAAADRALYEAKARGRNRVEYRALELPLA
ncbi:MAG: diguanylate cyclase [Xenococcus sp. (in: cyanobacteria)]